MKDIKIGEDYIFTLHNEKVNVLAKDVNSDGDVIYACKQLSDNRLYWSGEVDLEEIKCRTTVAMEELFHDNWHNTECSEYLPLYIADKKVIDTLKDHIMETYLVIGVESFQGKYVITTRDEGKIILSSLRYSSYYEGYTFTDIILDKRSVEGGDFMDVMLTMLEDQGDIKSKMVIV